MPVVTDTGTDQPHTAARMPGRRHSNQWIFGAMLFSAVLSLIASFVLSRDALELVANPEAALSCNINSVLNCGLVGISDQAAVFGFPNAFLGMMLEPVVITVAVAGLAGVRFPRWFMCAAQAVYLLGLIFAYWLFSQSLFSIGALCPWCLVITVGTTLVFMTLLHFNILENNLFLPARAHEWALSFVRSGSDLIVLTGWFIIVLALILVTHGTALFG